MSVETRVGYKTVDVMVELFLEPYIKAHTVRSEDTGMIVYNGRPIYLEMYREATKYLEGGKRE